MKTNICALIIVMIFINSYDKCHAKKKIEQKTQVNSMNELNLRISKNEKDKNDSKNKVNDTIVIR